MSHSLRVVLWDYSNLCTHRRRAASARLSCRKPWGGVRPPHSSASIFELCECGEMRLKAFAASSRIRYIEDHIFLQPDLHAVSVRRQRARCLAPNLVKTPHFLSRRQLPSQSLNRRIRKRRMAGAEEDRAQVTHSLTLAYLVIKDES